MSNRASICWKCIHRKDCRMFEKDPEAIVAVMSEVEICNLVVQNYQLVYAKDEEIGLVHNDKAEELFDLIKIVSR